MLRPKQRNTRYRNSLPVNSGQRLRICDCKENWQKFDVLKEWQNASFLREDLEWMIEIIQEVKEHKYYKDSLVGYDTFEHFMRSDVCFDYKKFKEQAETIIKLMESEILNK